MGFGSVDLQILASLVLVLGALLVALVCDLLKGNNEVLREKNVELRVRFEERERFQKLAEAHSGQPAGQEASLQARDLAGRQVRHRGWNGPASAGTSSNGAFQRAPAWATNEELRKVEERVAEIRARFEARSANQAPSGLASEAQGGPGSARASSASQPRWVPAPAGPQSKAPEGQGRGEDGTVVVVRPTSRGREAPDSPAFELASPEPEGSAGRNTTFQAPAATEVPGGAFTEAQAAGSSPAAAPGEVPRAAMRPAAIAEVKREPAAAEPFQATHPVTTSAESGTLTEFAQLFDPVNEPGDGDVAGSDFSAEPVSTAEDEQAESTESGQGRWPAGGVILPWPGSDLEEKEQVSSAEETPGVVSAFAGNHEQSQLAPSGLDGRAQSIGVRSHFVVPAGFHAPEALQALLELDEPFSGVVGIVAFERAPGDGASPRQEISRQLREVIEGCLGPADFACVTESGEYVLLLPDASGAAAALRIQDITRRLWDFRLRALLAGAAKIRFGVAEVSHQPLAEALRLARQRMESYRSDTAWVLGREVPSYLTQRRTHARS